MNTLAVSLGSAAHPSTACWAAANGLTVLTFKSEAKLSAGMENIEPWTGGGVKVAALYTTRLGGVPNSALTASNAELTDAGLHRSILIEKNPSSVQASVPFLDATATA